MKVNRTELAEIFGVSLTTIDGWIRRGCPGEKKSNRWQFDTREVFTWYRSAMTSDAEGLDLTKERALLTRAQRKLKEIDIKIRKGDLIPVDEVLREWQGIIANVRGKLLAMPTRCAIELAVENTAPGCQKVLKKAVCEALTELRRNE